MHHCRDLFLLEQFVPLMLLHEALKFLVFHLFEL